MKQYMMPSVNEMQMHHISRINYSGKGQEQIERQKCQAQMKCMCNISQIIYSGKADECIRNSEETKKQRK